MNATGRIRLFVDAHSFDKEHQGIRAFIKGLYTELSKVAPDVDFYFGAKNIENLKEELHDISNCYFVKYKYSSTLLRLGIEIPYLLYKNKIDIAHFQYISPFIKCCSYIVTIHDVLFKEFKEQFSPFYRFSRDILFRQSIQKADIKTTVSEYSRTMIQKHYQVNPNEILIIHNGINRTKEAGDKAVSKNYMKESHGIEKYLLYVSRFEPRKNHMVLLKAYLDLQLYKKGYFLVFIGHTSIRERKYENLYLSLPEHIKKFIFVSGEINDAELRHFYKAADLFVYPSMAEGFGLPPIEAGALGIPVICSNTTAMRDFTFFGDCHLDPENYDRFRDKIKQMIDNPPDAKKLAEIADDIVSKYAFRPVANLFYQAISDCVRKAKS